jgi:hypothetical protein
MRIFDTAGYLPRLRLGDPGAPSVSALQILHKAHVELNRWLHVSTDRYKIDWTSLGEP